MLKRVVVCAGVLGLAGCSAASPTTPGPGGGSAVVVEAFTGTLALKASTFYSFSVETSGETFLTLVDAKENGVTTEALITIGLGAPRGTQCLATNVLSVKSSGQAQLSGPTARGIHCALVFDPGNLTSPATFHVNIVHPR